MTSSLVGSEMCIRDRSIPGDCILTWWKHWTIRTLSRAKCGYRCATGTVSYTHLTLPTICSV
eukprot:5725831-Prorocentrum_lima.AAC.1